MLVIFLSRIDKQICESAAAFLLKCKHGHFFKVGLLRTWNFIFASNKCKAIYKYTYRYLQEPWIIWFSAYDFVCAMQYACSCVIAMHYWLCFMFTFTIPFACKSCFNRFAAVMNWVIWFELHYAKMGHMHICTDWSIGTLLTIKSNNVA